MKQFDDTQQTQYNNYRELFLVVGSFLIMVIYLKTPFSASDLGQWIFLTVLAATAIINLALYLIPMPKREVFIPLYPYAKANAFSGFMWLVVSLAVGWRTVLHSDWVGICLTIACFVLGLLMVIGGTFVHVFFRTLAINNMIQDDYSTSHNNTIEKYWLGTLPEKVDDYAQPRYVYADGVECVKPRPEGGQIIGYRISPTLVIHSATCDKNYSHEFLSAFMARFHGQLLTADEVDILKRNWDIVSKMRMDVGESPLPTPYFWYAGAFRLESTHYRENFTESYPESSAVILKR